MQLRYDYIANNIITCRSMLFANTIISKIFLTFEYCLTRFLPVHRRVSATSNSTIFTHRISHESKMCPLHRIACEDKMCVYKTDLIIWRAPAVHVRIYEVRIATALTRCRQEARIAKAGSSCYRKKMYSRKYELIGE